MRLLTAIVASSLLAFSASAQVRLVIKKDGSKLIFNDSRATGSGRVSDYTWLAKQHDRRSPYDAFIEKYSRLYGVDPVLVRAVIQIESNFNPNCVSPKGARGLMQLMPDTARRFGVKRVHDPEDNIRGGVAYLAILLRMFDDLPHALAAYNAGEGAVQRYNGIPPYEETATYVKRGLTVYYGRPYGGSVGGAVSFAGRRGKSSLTGGFRPTAVPPLAAAAMFPGARYLGTH
jgi:soluble lytic murein transglycosylase-like protein